MSETIQGLAMVLDLSKARVLNKGKLVKKRVAVKGKNGHVFYRMQWVDPNDKNPDFKHPGGDTETTYSHHEDGIKDMERAQSNRFPVMHHKVSELQENRKQKHVDPKEVQKAKDAYHEGHKLPPIQITPHGEVLNNHHLVELAKELGLSHVPVIVMGNSQQKKELEDRLKDQVTLEDKNDQGKKVTVEAREMAVPKKVSKNGGSQSYDHPDVRVFKEFTSKKYTKTHIMNEARKAGIKWDETIKSGDRLSEDSSIMWMRAYQAIVDHLAMGKPFDISHDEKDVDKRMEQDGWDSIEKHFRKLLEKHGGKQQLMEWAQNNDITWKASHDPNINWMRCSTEIKKMLAQGKMVDGVRTRQKEAMDRANLIIGDQVKQRVKELSLKYGKEAMMNRATELGIKWETKDKKGNDFTHPDMIWMRASAAISEFIARGGDFTIGEDDPEKQGITGAVGDYGGVKLNRMQAHAVDLGKRNSQNFELKAKDWALKAYAADHKLDGNEALLQYEKFKEGAKRARLMVHFDPTEILPSGDSLLEQLSSDGMLKNNWEYGKVDDAEAMEINERELFDIDYDEAAKSERPVYGVLDLFNQGLKSSPYGEVAFVLNDNAKKRTTGVHTDSSNLQYETNGKLTRGMEDPHHLVVDRWMTKWKTPKNADSKRRRYMDAVTNGTKANDDEGYFETHIHGGLDLRRDVDHILVPDHWQTDDDHEDKHEAIKAFAGLMGLTIKYE